jgi:transglutaminase-like putative cysteine protease
MKQQVSSRDDPPFSFCLLPYSRLRVLAVNPPLPLCVEPFLFHRKNNILRVLSTDMRRDLRQLLLLLFVLLSGIAEAQRPRVEKEPSWITRNELDLSGRRLDVQAEAGYVDQAYEKQVNLAQQAVYHRIAIRILSEAGVQNNSEISLDFNPSYEQLVIHSINIRRGNEIINRLNLSKIKTIQQETDRYKFQYNGSMTALLLLDDVRKGDVIDYSFTRKGFNPVFEGKYSDFFTTKFDIPIYHLYYKLIVPAGRNIAIRNDRTDVKSTIRQMGTETVHEWKLSEVEPARIQKNIPSWYDPYPCVMISDYRSWQEVSAWAAKLYPFDIALSPALKKKIEEIRGSHKSIEQQALAAIRFVQDEVRYYGIEMGAHSHKPHHPNQIFAQRYGDCKDKTYLLCILLRGLGIEADPVLVNTVYKKTIRNWLPSAHAFDHVTVRAKVNGRYYWLDPTINYQRGSLDKISYPDYQAGLVISPQAQELVSIPANRNSQVKVKEVLNIPDMNGKAKLTVTTFYEGGAADGVRSQFQENSLYEMEQKYLEYYTAYFEQLNCDSLRYEEAENGGFITREYYTISGIWTEENGKKELFVSPYVINGIIQKPTEAVRTMPFALEFPLKYSETIQIKLPDEWETESSSSEITSDNFTFRSSYSSHDRTIELNYEYENLKDHIAPEEADEYFARYRELNEGAGFRLTWDSKLAQFNSSQSISSDSFGSWRDMFNVAYVIIGLLVIITYLVRRKNTANQREW